MAMNPVIKFTTLFGLLAVELAVTLPPNTSRILAGVFFAISLVFVYRSFYGMRIKTGSRREEGHRDQRHRRRQVAPHSTPQKPTSLPPVGDRSDQTSSSHAFGQFDRQRCNCIHELRG